jgi:hypothetical protein
MADISQLLGRLPGQGGGGPPPGGGAPPGGGGMMPAAAPNVGSAAQPQGMGGNVAMAMIQIHNAVQALEKSLPMIPMGSPLHAELLKATTSIIKHLPPGSENPQLQLMAVINQAREQSQQQPMAAMDKLYPPPAAAGGGARPAPAGGGGPMPMAA